MKSELSVSQMKKQRIIVIAIFVFAIFVYISAICFFFLPIYRTSMYEEWSYHMEETTRELSETYNQMQLRSERELRMFTQNISDSGMFTTEELLKRTGEDSLESMMENQIYVLIEPDGTGHLIGNRTCYFLKNAQIDQFENMILDIDIPELIDRRRMVFAMPLPEEIVTKDGVTISSAAICIPMSNYVETLRTDTFERENIGFVIDKEGTVLYAGEDIIGIKRGVNIWEVMETYTIIHAICNGSIEDRINTRDLFELKDTTILSDTPEGKYFISFQPSVNPDWYVLFVVPYSAVTKHTKEFVSSIIGGVIFFFIGIISLFLFFLFFSLFSPAREKQIEEKRRMNEVLDAATKEIEETNRKKRDFISRISHDVRTPINGILGMLTIAEKSADDPELFEDCLDKMELTLDHMDEFIHKSLDEALIEGGTIVLERNTFSLSSVIDQVGIITQGRLEGKDVELKTDCSRVVHDEVTGSELHLKQILLNVLSNAEKYTQKGEIVLSAKELDPNSQNGRYCFEIKDTGIGMEEEFLQQIFESYKTENRSDVKESSGLGLHIVKLLLELMGGSIQIESEIKVGTTVRIEVNL